MLGTITEFLNSCTKLEILCLALASVVVLLAILCAASRPRLRSWLVFIMDIVVLVILLIYAKGKPFPQRFPLYLVAGGLGVALICWILPLMRWIKTEMCTRKDQKRSQKTSH